MKKLSLFIFFISLVFIANAKIIKLENLSKQSSFEDSCQLIHRFLNGISHQHDQEQLLRDFETIENIISNKNIDSLLALVYEKRGTVLKKLSKIEDAFLNYDRAIEIYSTIGNKKSLARTYYNKGKIYLNKLDFEAALDIHLKSLKIYDELDDKLGQAKVYMEVGIIYDYQDQFDQALKYYKKGLDIYIRLDNKKGMSNGYNNVGVMYDIQGKLDLALEYYNKSMTMDKSLGDSLGVAGSEVNIGLIYQAKDDVTKAEKLYLKALSRYESYQDSYGISICYNNLADLYRESGQFEKAINSLNKSIILANKAKNVKQLIDNYEILLMIYRDMGDFENAFKYQGELMILKDSVFVTDQNEKIIEFQEQYESEKKEREIEGLSKENALKKLEISKNKNNELILFGGIGIISIVAFFLFYQHQQGKKMNTKLSFANVELEDKNVLIQTKNQEITDSIQYAKKIQEALLPESQFFGSFLPNSFVVYKPKDIVSGDFYWCEKVDNKILYAAVDCTGHGVPGAFMSIVGFNGLKKAVQDSTKISAGEILNNLNKNVMAALHTQNQNEQIKDGMDIALCVLDIDNKKLEFSGARNPLYLIRNKKLQHIKGDKRSIGEENGFYYNTHTFDLQTNDSIYIFTDGFADQFGGVKGKKLNYPKFRELLVNASELPLELQSEYLSDFMNDWRGAEEQVDDICVIGMKVT